jgi:hypothetical protein
MPRLSGIYVVKSGNLLIKSQGQRGPEPNIDKKAKLFSTVACFFFDNGRVYVLPRFRYKTSTAVRRKAGGKNE